MRIAVISDIHGNLEALTAVFADIDRAGVDFTVCLGDIVGYYPDPEACVDIVRDRCVYAVSGNHDAAVVGELISTHFNLHAQAAIDWTVSHLSAESKIFLASLPQMVRLEGMLFTHASPADPGAFTYLFPADRIRLSQAFSEMVSPICCVGHTHWPFIATRHDSGMEMLNCDGPVSLVPQQYYLVNVGSVGQPRDNDARASWALIDTADRTVEILRVIYDWRVTQRKVTQCGLPTFLAQRLSKGT